MFNFFAGILTVYYLKKTAIHSFPQSLLLMSCVIALTFLSQEVDATCGLPESPTKILGLIIGGSNKGS